MFMNIYLLEGCSTTLKALFPRLAKNNIHVVENINDSDVVVGYDFNQVAAIRNKKKLYWVNEPRYSSITKDKVRLDNGEIVHIMNCFTDNVFVDIFNYLWVTKGKKIDYIDSNTYVSRKEKNKIAHIVSSVHNYNPFIINDKNIDLYKIRDDIAILGNRLGLVDIYGQNWPNDINVLNIETRSAKEWDDWETAKFKISQTYLFSICIENTNINNYVTEKFWHSIMSQTLPIYYIGSTNIYNWFDKDLIIGADNFENYQDLFHFISCMSEKEYLTRINALIEQANRYITGGNVINANREKIIYKVYEKLLLIKQQEDIL